MQLPFHRPLGEAERRRDLAQLEALVVAHRFGGVSSGTIEAPLPAGVWRIEETLDDEAPRPEIRAAGLVLKLDEWQGQALRLTRV